MGIQTGADGCNQQTLEHLVLENDLFAIPFRDFLFSSTELGDGFMSVGAVCG